eukprot:CAMPEP_0179119846 /NCGR_PEP_ID=MMETSP0796-20121207/56440_1 /TAXON_ID=73915 /ORGANISM="Pyrodinium bahamense, Strain pbaha01" /LENGTH=223 /DNA_ID=CAMNT_0020818369 /DNA_START=1 /DNA_END=669 /DNA_ORIENTATION=+
MLERGHALQLGVNERVDEVGRQAEDMRERYLRFLWGGETDAEAGICSSETPVSRAEVQLNYPPEQLGPSLLSQSLADQLSNFLPASLRFQQWNCTFTPHLHGVSLRTLYRCFQQTPGPSVLLVRDTGGRIFGGFASEAWRCSGKYYGNGECFVFSLRRPIENADRAGGGVESLQVHTWSGLNRFFMFSDSATMAMGQGGQSAISIAGDLLRGSSLLCDTFTSP